MGCDPNSRSRLPAGSFPPTARPGTVTLTDGWKARDGFKLDDGRNARAVAKGPP